MILSEYVVPFLYVVYAQQFFFLGLLRFENFVISRRYWYMLYAVGFSFILAVNVLQIRFIRIDAYYLSLYAFLVLGVYTVLLYRHDVKTSICLAFLLTFINSYYWEFPLHVSAILYHGLTFNGFLQTLHLLSVPYLYVNFNFKPRPEPKRKIPFLSVLTRVNLWIVGGLLASSYLILLDQKLIEYEIFGYTRLIHIIARLVCLAILTKIFFEAEAK